MQLNETQLTQAAVHAKKLDGEVKDLLRIRKCITDTYFNLLIELNRELVAKATELNRTNQAIATREWPE